MVMTKNGIIKRKATMIAKHGSYQNYLKFMREIAKVGGKKITDKTRLKGWGSNKELAAIQGKKNKKLKK